MCGERGLNTHSEQHLKEGDLTPINKLTERGGSRAENISIANTQREKEVCWWIEWLMRGQKYQETKIIKKRGITGPLARFRSESIFQ